MQKRLYVINYCTRKNTHNFIIFTCDTLAKIKEYMGANTPQILSN